MVMNKSELTHKLDKLQTDFDKEEAPTAGASELIKNGIMNEAAFIEVCTPVMCMSAAVLACKPNVSCP